MLWEVISYVADHDGGNLHFGGWPGIGLRGRPAFDEELHHRMLAADGRSADFFNAVITPIYRIGGQRQRRARFHASPGLYFGALASDGCGDNRLRARVAAIQSAGARPRRAVMAERQKLTAFTGAPIAVLSGRRSRKRFLPSRPLLLCLRTPIAQLWGHPSRPPTPPTPRLPPAKSPASIPLRGSANPHRQRAGTAPPRWALW